MRRRRRKIARQLNDHDVELMLLAEDLDRAGDGERAEFIRGLVRREPSTVIEVVGVRRWLREMAAHPDAGRGGEDPELRAHFRELDRWYQDRLSSRLMYPVGDRPRLEERVETVE